MSLNRSLLLPVCNYLRRYFEFNLYVKRMVWISSWIAALQKKLLAMTVRVVMLILSILIFCFWISSASGATVASSPVSINFVDIKTRDLLKILAESLNKSVMISDKITDKITINLRNISWREALDAVLQMRGLVKSETDHVITILTADEVHKSGQEILRPEVFNLRHASAESVDKLLKPGGILSTHGKSGVAAGTNSLVIADTDYKIAAIGKLLKQIDVPAKQVLIEARIVNADENFMQELGVELGSNKNGIKIDSQRGQFDFQVARLGNNTLLDLELSALESEGRGKIISRPKLLTMERQDAYIEAGAEIPYQEKTKEGDTSTSFKKAVLSLKVTPEVVEDNLVSLSLQLNQDKVGQLLVNGVPTIDTHRIQTQVLVHDNETVVLGGIYEWGKRAIVTGVPFLGKIPVVGVLFRKKEIKMERKELLIFVTPRIMK